VQSLADFLVPDTLRKAVSNGKYLTKEHSTQLGFLTRGFLNILPFTGTNAFGDPAVIGYFAQFVFLDAASPATYLSATLPTPATATKVGTATGGGAMTLIYTLYSKITGEELVLSGVFYPSNTVPPEFSATNHYLFSMSTTPAIPAGFEVRVYLARDDRARSAKLLGSISATGTANALIYIGQPLDEGRSFPMNYRVLNDFLITGANTKNYLNSSLLASHTVNDFPFTSGAPAVFALGLSATTVAQTFAWKDGRLITAGFGLDDFPTDIGRFFGTNRVAFSNIPTSRSPRLTMHLPAEAVSAEEPFSLDVLGVNEVYHVVPHKRLLLFTDKGVHTVGSISSDGLLTRETANIGDSNGYVADIDVEPVVAGNEVYFATARVSSVMRAQFEREINGYSFFDVSFTAKDLFQRGAGIRNMCYTRGNYNTLWCFHRGIEDQPTDIVTACTLRDGDQRIGVHRHDFNAKIIDAISLSSSDKEDRMYMLTERTDRSGNPRIFLERMFSREAQNNLVDVEPRFNYRFYDCFTEGVADRFTGSVVVPNSGTEQGNVFTVTATAHGLTLTPGAKVRIKFGAVTWDAEIVSSTLNAVDVLSDEDCPFSGTLVGAELIQLANSFNIGPEYWGFDVGLMVDGRELANSNPGSGLPRIVVPNPVTGPLTLPVWFDYWIIGFNFVSEVQSVSYVPPLDVPNVDVQKRLHSIDVEFEHTKDLFISGYEPEDVTPREMSKVKDFTDTFEKDYYTGRFNIPVRGEANQHARVLFRQVRAAPFTILGYEASVDM
jgi:hypothetical protein